jgi:hypothetical protein
MLVGGKLPHPVSIHEAWERVRAYLEEKAGFAYLPEHHLAAGLNPDKVNHLVVCCNGVLVHDPNPLRRGIISAQWIEWLVPLSLVPSTVEGMPCAEWQVEW